MKMVAKRRRKGVVKLSKAKDMEMEGKRGEREEREEKLNEHDSGQWPIH